MRRQTYAILRTPRARGGNPYRGVLGKGPEEHAYGLESTAHEEGVDVDVDIEELQPNEVNDLKRDETVEGIAPSMDIQLIQPVSEENTEELPATGNGDCWGIRAVGAEACPYTGAGITVAILDSGIDADHPAFANVELIQRDFTTRDEPASCPDEIGHGTHCAGTLFGGPVDGVRIGVASGVKKAVVGKVFGKNGGGTTAQIYKAIDWAADQGAHIISMSAAINFVGYITHLKNTDLPDELAVQEALNAYRDNILLFDHLVRLLDDHPTAQPLLIAASGNDSRRRTNPDFEIGAGMPAATKDVVAVGALGRNSDMGLSVTDVSNIGVDIVAPGSAIYSAEANGGLCYKAGTSMAAPHVAGVAALWAEKLMTQAGRVDPVILHARLIGQATETGLAPGYHPRAVGAGLVQAPRA